MGILLGDNVVNFVLNNSVKYSSKWNGSGYAILR